MTNITNDELTLLYENKKLSCNSIAKLFKCNPETIRIRLIKIGIKLRPKFWKQFRPDITEELIRREYISNKKTQKQIAEEYHCDEDLIFRRMRKFGILARPRPEHLRGRKFTLEHRINLSNAKIGALLGEKNPNWRGGTFLTNSAIRQRSNYTVFRRRVLRLKGDKCELCGRKLRAACPTCAHIPDRHVHHKLPFSTNHSTRFSFDNAIVICESCHLNQHRKKRP